MLCLLLLIALPVSQSTSPIQIGNLPERHFVILPLNFPLMFPIKFCLGGPLRCHQDANRGPSKISTPPLLPSQLPPHTYGLAFLHLDLMVLEGRGFPLISQESLRIFKCQQHVIPPTTHGYPHLLSKLPGCASSPQRPGLAYRSARPLCFRVMSAHSIFSERCDWYRLKAEVFPQHRLDEFVCIVTATQPSRREDLQKAQP